jgi:hypothetical protein
MNVDFANVLTIGICIFASVPAVGADIALETRDVQLVIGGGGALKHLTAKATGEEYLRTDKPCPMAIVCRGGEPSADHRAMVADTKNWRAFVDSEVPVYYAGEAYPATKATRDGNTLVGRQYDQDDVRPLRQATQSASTRPFDGCRSASS